MRPNFDTLYSIAWLDLRRGPVRIRAPDTHGRYYCMHMMDAWTDTFAVPGSRTWGTAANSCTVVWHPDGHEGDDSGGAVLRSPTPFVWIIHRIQTNGEADYDAVHALQDGFRIEPGAVPAAEDTPWMQIVRGCKWRLAV